jgi:hypothetical protein
VSLALILAAPPNSMRPEGRVVAVGRDLVEHPDRARNQGNVEQLEITYKWLGHDNRR